MAKVRKQSDQLTVSAQITSEAVLELELIVT